MDISGERIGGPGGGDHDRVVDEPSSEESPAGYPTSIQLKLFDLFIAYPFSLDELY